MTAGDVRSVAEGLRRQGNDPPAQVAVQAADRMECVGGYPKESDADTIPRDLEAAKPWAVALGGLAIGFAAWRFLKALVGGATSSRSSLPSAGRSHRATACRRCRPRARRTWARRSRAITMSDDSVHDDLRDRPIGDLLKQLSQETTTLVRQGARARQGRMAEKGKRAGLGAGMFGGAGVAALIGRGALTDTIIAALDTAMALAGRP